MINPTVEAAVQPAKELDQGLFWKALADPTRRTLMDLVRESPKTTGQLVGHFETIGRCAVMKHLSILEQAHLIIPKKEGRHRWNYINALPLQQIYERWVKQYEAQWASNLMQLKEVAEYKQHIDKLTEDLVMEKPARTIEIKMEIPIAANQELVWDCLAQDMSIWWRKDFYTSPNTEKMILEPWVGGRMYEDYGDNNGLLWANVIVMNKPHVMEFRGHMTPQFGGPATTFTKLSLKEDGDQTILTLENTVFGAISEGTEDSLSGGWKMLYEDAFKSYAETKAKG